MCLNPLPSKREHFLSLSDISSARLLFRVKFVVTILELQMHQKTNYIGGKKESERDITYALKQLSL